ncbi:hypothetical protein Emag_004707 [Eimeria magna]
MTSVSRNPGPAATCSTLSLLQVEAGGEKDESEGEAGSSSSESTATQSSRSQEQESSSEASGGSEEQHGDDASHEGSKLEKTLETPQTKRSPSMRESSSAKESSGESSQEGTSEQVRPSPAEEAPKSTASGQSSAKSAPVHGAEASASASEAASKVESLPESTPLGASNRLTTESNIETPKGERNTHVSRHELPEKEKGSKEETGAADFFKPNIPPASKTVVQLNFRPSMVLGSGEGDTVDRHVIAEAGGTKWYQVVGKKDLTILKLKPMEGEQILHQESVTEQPS